MHPSPNNDEPLLAEINVTPLVDVMLVLLIIFMVSAPLLQQGVEVDLPQANAKELQPQEEPLIISMTKDGQVHINEETFSRLEFEPKIKAIIKNQPERLIYLRADGSLPYKQIIEIIAFLKESGAIKLGMATRIPE